MMYGKFLLTAFLLIAGFCSLTAKDLKVLMVGNSFSVCVGFYLPQIVKSVPGHRLELTSAYIGGCSLERHCRHLREAEKNPEVKPYSIRCWDTAAKKNPVFTRRDNLNSVLKKGKYDIITIQQASGASWNYKTYQPYADELIAYIRKYQPKAEIVIQQTWAYRKDGSQLKPNPTAKWDFDQTGMYERIRDAYRKLAEAHHLRVIPTGDAVQLFRKYTPVKFQVPTKKFEYPERPSTAGDVVGNVVWRKDPKTGKYILRIDPNHLNASGHYLQACLWFAFLYGEPTSKIAFAPQNMKGEECALLRKCAQEAQDHYQQVK